MRIVLGVAVFLRMMKTVPQAKSQCLRDNDATRMMNVILSRISASGTYVCHSECHLIYFRLNFLIFKRETKILLKTTRRKIPNKVIKM